MTTPSFPRVSVVVPTHNRARLLPLTLRSILWQQGVELEVLVIDDGSTEDLRRVVRELDDPRVRLLRQEPQGVSVARNRGVAEVTGRWVAFVDDDDLWAPNKLITQVHAAEEAGRGWVYAGAVNVTEDLRLLGGAPPADVDEVMAGLTRANLIPGGCSGVIVRRDLLPQNPFDPSYRHFADWDLWIRLSRSDRPATVTAPLVGYRVHGGNRSLDTVGMIAELDVIEKRYGGPVDRARFYRHVARVSLRASRHYDGLRYYFQAAVRDSQYRVTDFVPDLIEIGQGLAGSIRRRLARAGVGAVIPERPRRPPDRYAAQRPWVEQARPWLDELAAYRSET
jgi:glycosyltransferase involved in cell wall biosynthesis